MVTRAVSQFEIRNFPTNGLTIVSLPMLSELLTQIRQSIFTLFNTMRMAIINKPVYTDQDLVDFYQENKQQQFHAVKSAAHLPQFYTIVHQSALLEVLRILGLKQPILDTEPMLRCDMPIFEQCIFSQHQDYTYNIGSQNAVTVWIPLQDTSIEEGALKIVPGSHHQGIFPHDNNKGIILPRYQFNFVACPVNFSQVLIFNQKLVHESGVNRSQRIRFSIILRYSDLQDKEYSERLWPRNHSIKTHGFAVPTVKIPEKTGITR